MGIHFEGKHSYDSTNLSVVLTKKDGVVIQSMSIGDSHEAITLLDKRSDEQSLQRVKEYVASACTEVGFMVRADFQKLERPWLVENHSHVSQIAGVALKNGQKDLLFLTQSWVALEF